MFNTITVSLLERTKEIGLMVALGARRHDMRKLFIIETTLISVIGAAVGSSFDLFSNPAWLIAGMVLFMVIIGLIVAYIPSRRAEKINPIDALRHE